MWLALALVLALLLACPILLYLMTPSMLASG